MIRIPYKLRTKERKPRNKYLHFIRYKVDCLCENIYIKYASLPKIGINTKEEREHKIVVSLTSFPQRMPQTYYGIKSLMLQSMKADRIVLWLSEQQFPDKKIPAQFGNLIQRGLEVRFVKDDLRSHKKYYYALQEQKENEVVVTFDDDLIYENKAIERVFLTHLKYPDCIVCNRGQVITFTSDSIIATYNSWKTNSPIGVNKPSYLVMPSTGAGCLYPYGIMPPTTFDVKAIKEKAFTADDIWMKFNSLNAGVNVIKTLKNTAMLCPVKDSQKTHLGQINCIQGVNDIVVRELSSYFPKAVSLLKQCHNR